jgi:cytochrome c oxidase subunit 2
MPLVVEALPPAQFAAWVKAQGGSMPGEEKPVPAAPAATATTTETVAAPAVATTN